MLCHKIVIRVMKYHQNSINTKHIKHSINHKTLIQTRKSLRKSNKDATRDRAEVNTEIQGEVIMMRVRSTRYHYMLTLLYSICRSTGRPRSRPRLRITPETHKFRVSISRPLMAFGCCCCPRHTRPLQCLRCVV